MATHSIIAIKCGGRRENADRLQKVLTKYGCIVKMRLGLHETGDLCSDDGLILLQLAGDPDKFPVFLDELNELSGIRAKLIEL